jgi:Domain of unknown function (DUF1918)
MAQKKNAKNKDKAPKAQAKKADGKKARGAGPDAPADHAKPVAPGEARRGDLIVVDAAKVGSPAREGEILRVMTGGLTVSYQVRWSDGHESVISPGAGAAHILRS